MDDNTENNRSPTDEASTSENDRVNAPNPQIPNPDENSDPDADLYGLEALCRVLFGTNPEAILGAARGLSRQQVLYMRQQEEQERRRRALQTALTGGSETSNPNERRRFRESPTYSVPDIRQLRLDLLRNFGNVVTADEENTNDRCPICLQTYVPNDILRKLTCNHIFHQECVDQWLWKDASCPICRAAIVDSVGDRYPEANASTSEGNSGALHDEAVGGTEDRTCDNNADSMPTPPVASSSQWFSISVTDPLDFTPESDEEDDEDDDFIDFNI